MTGRLLLAFVRDAACAEVMWWLTRWHMWRLDHHRRWSAYHSQHAQRLGRRPLTLGRTVWHDAGENLPDA